MDIQSRGAQPDGLGAGVLEPASELPEGPAPWTRLVAWRWPLFLAFAFATAIACFGLPLLWFDVSNEALFVEDDPNLAEFRALQETFGSDEVLYCLFEVEDPFAGPTRRKLLAFGDRLQALGAAPGRHSFSESLRSPLHSPVVYDVEGELTSRSLAQAEAAGELESEAELSVWRERVLGYRPFKDLMISADGRYVAFVVRLDPRAIRAGLKLPDPPGGDPYAMPPQARQAVAQEVAALLAEPEWAELKGVVIGTPIITSELAAILGREIGRALLGGLAVAFVALLLLFRHPLAAGAPFALIVLTLLGTLGLRGLSGVPLSQISGILLTLVICVGIADAMHLVAAYERICSEGLERRAACAQALAETWRPCLWTSLTTAAGFLALLSSKLAPIRHLGVSAALSCVLAYGALLLVAPALLVAWRPRPRPAGLGGGVGRLLGLCERLVARRPGWVVGVAALAAALALPGVARLDVNSDPFDDLAPEEPLRQRLEFVHERMGGAVAAEVVIQPLVPPEDNIPPAEILARAAELEDWLRARDPEVIRAVVGISSGILEISKAFDLPVEVPRDSRQAGQLMLLLSGSDSGFYGQHVATDGSALRITIRMKLTGSKTYDALLGELERELERRFEGLATTHITGGARLLGKSNDYMIATQRESFLLALLVVSLLIAASTRDLRLGLLSLIPNVLPAALVLGLMGWLDVPITVPIALIATVALGIIVDDTIHLIHCVREELRPGVSMDEALERTFARAGRAILFTTLVLIGSFAVYLGAALTNLRRFGVIAAGAFLAAFVADVLVLPALLRLTTRESDPEPSGGALPAEESPQDAPL